MAERFRTTQTITYPANEESVRLVRDTGGESKLSPEHKTRYKTKTVAAGKWCDDVPKESQAWLLLYGAIERVTVEDDASKPKRKV